MWSGVSSVYGTPLGLIAKWPASRSTPETLPKVPVTRPLDASSRLAAHTDSFKSTGLMTAVLRGATMSRGWQRDWSTVPLGS